MDNNVTFPIPCPPVHWAVGEYSGMIYLRFVRNVILKTAAFGCASVIIEWDTGSHSMLVKDVRTVDAFNIADLINRARGTLQ